MAVLNTPAGEADLNSGIGAVVAVAIGDKEKIWRGSEPETVEADGEGGRERDAFEEDFARIEDAVAVGVFEDEDATVAVIGEAGLAGFVVEPYK